VEHFSQQFFSFDYQLRIAHAGIVASKVLTQAQAETAKKRASIFLRNVLQDRQRADEVEAESLQDWAAETGRRIVNPHRRSSQIMAQSSPSKADLQDLIDQASDIVNDALDPALTREAVVEKLQDLDSLLNGDEEADEEEAEEEYIDED